MKAIESSVPGIQIHGPETPDFERGLVDILGRAPKELLKPALPFSVILENESERVVAFHGVRFDMVGARGRQYSVVHYADSLRNPLKADFKPGSFRFVCAEPAYTALVLRGDVAAETRGRMNLETLRKMLHIKASIDCVAFADGEFAGPDSEDTFDRFAAERETEEALLAEMKMLALAPNAEIEAMLYHAVQDPVNRARRYAARKLLEGYEAGGRAEALVRASNFRLRVALWRTPVQAVTKK